MWVGGVGTGRAPQGEEDGTEDQQYKYENFHDYQLP